MDRKVIVEQNERRLKRGHWRNSGQRKQTKQIKE